MRGRPASAPDPTSGCASDAGHPLKEDYDKAIADYDEAIRIQPRFSFAYENRGSAWKSRREYDKALADYNEAVRLGPNDAAVYYNRGSVWNLKKAYGQAVADFGEAIRLDPENTLAHNDLAMICASAPDGKVRDGRRAVESATRACEISKWRNPGHVDTLAASHAEAGDFAAAVKWQKKAIGLLGRADKAMIADFRSRLELYREGKPYRAAGVP